MARLSLLLLAAFLMCLAAAPLIAFDELTESGCLLTGALTNGNTEESCPEYQSTEGWVPFSGYAYQQADSWYADGVEGAQQVWVEWACDVGYIDISASATPGQVSLSVYWTAGYGYPELLVFMGWAYYDGSDQSYGWPGSATDGGSPPCAVYDFDFWAVQW